MKGMLVAAVMAASIVSLAGCGSSGSSGAAHNSEVISKAQQSAASEQSIKRAFLGLPDARTDDIGDVEYLAPGENPGDLSVNAGCTVDVIMASPEDVAPYKGDNSVVLNPAGTAGVKVVGTEQSQVGCLQTAAQVLKGVK